MNLLLDTSGLIHFFRKQPQAFSAAVQAERIYVPVIALGEWLAGVQGQTVLARKTQLLTDFIARPRVSVQSINADTPAFYAHLFHYLKKRGTPVPTNDLWIAACAMQVGARVLTSDNHFLRMPQLLVEFVNE